MRLEAAPFQNVDPARIFILAVRLEAAPFQDVDPVRGFLQPVEVVPFPIGLVSAFFRSLLVVLSWPDVG